MIVHVKEVGTQDGTQVGVEWWQQTSPPHALRMFKGPVGHEIEGTSTGGKLVDPIAGVRQQLARGGAQVAGTARIDGTTLYKIELPTRVIAYFDMKTYRPVYLDNLQAGGGVVRTRVVTYEELPMTPDNARLLK
jgi:hypothetical protein